MMVLYRILLHWYAWMKIDNTSIMKNTYVQNPGRICARKGRVICVMWNRASGSELPCVDMYTTERPAWRFGDRQRAREYLARLKLSFRVKLDSGKSQNYTTSAARTETALVNLNRAGSCLVTRACNHQRITIRSTEIQKILSRILPQSSPTYEPSFNSVNISSEVNLPVVSTLYFG